MPTPNSQRPDFPLVELVLGAVADWVTRYRDNISSNDMLGRCTADDVGRVAKDLGMTSGELRSIADRGPGADALLHKMLRALKVDGKVLAETEPAVLRDLQRLCIMCHQKRRCQHEMARGTAAEHFHEFCPNSFTLDALIAPDGLPDRK